MDLYSRGEAGEIMKVFVGHAGVMETQERFQRTTWFNLSSGQLGKRTDK